MPSVPTATGVQLIEGDNTANTTSHPTSNFDTSSSKKRPFWKFFPAMACAPSEVAALADRLNLLAMLAANPAAMKLGLAAVVRAGRRNGLNAATFAGVTLTVDSPPGAEKAQVRSKKGITDDGRPRAPATGSRAPNSRRSGRKSAAQQKKDTERYAARRMKHKFLPVMHLVSKFVHEQQQQPLSVDAEELPQFQEPPAGTPGTSQAMQVAQHQPLQPGSECRRLDCNAQRVDSSATATMAGCKHGISSPSRPTGRDGSPTEQPQKRFSEYSNRGRNGEAARLGRQLEADLLAIGGCSGRDQPG